MFKQELLAIVTTWSLEQLENYIEQLETRIVNTHALVKELKAIRKRKLSRKTLDNGPRGGI